MVHMREKTSITPEEPAYPLLRLPPFLVARYHTARGVEDQAAITSKIKLRKFSTAQKGAWAGGR